MITAWVLYLSPAGEFKFEELSGLASLNSTNPSDWGLAPDSDVILVIQQAQFIEAFVRGRSLINV